jgi:hypothetical protein
MSLTAAIHAASGLLVPRSTDWDDESPMAQFDSSARREHHTAARL